MLEGEAPILVRPRYDTSIAVRWAISQQTGNNARASDADIKRARDEADAAEAQRQIPDYQPMTYRQAQSQTPATGANTLPISTRAVVGNHIEFLET